MKINPLIVIILLLNISVSCSEKDVMDMPQSGTSLDPYDKSVISYFQEIALGFEFSSASEITRKWTSSMKIYIQGNTNDELLNTLQTIIEDIEKLVSDDFTIEIVDKKSDSNYLIFFGSHNEYSNLYPHLSDQATDNWGLFNVYWNSDNELNSGQMYVDTYRANLTEQKHLLREELTQSLGLARDSERFHDSIFQQNWTTVTNFSTIDKDLIRLLYHPEMKVGFNKWQVEKVLTTILLSEKSSN